MQDDFYSQQRGGNGRSRKSAKGDTSSIPSPCREGVTLLFKAEVIKSSEIKEKTFKSPFNTRSADHLSEASLLDILPSIRSQKRNTQPALGAKDANGMIEIIAGLRRSKSVSLVDDAEFVIFTCENMNDDEKRHFALTSDIYKAPCHIDVGVTIKNFIANAKEQGNKVTYAEAAKVYEISVGKVSEVMGFAELPNELFMLFPTLDDIGYRFLREVVKHAKVNMKSVRDAIQLATKEDFRLSIEQVENSALRDSTVKDLQNFLLESIKASKTKQNDDSSQSLWADLPETKGVKISILKSGKAKISIDESKLSDELSKELLKLLTT
jgi:ParB/RepB/Spo0J family partition protein